MLKAFVSFGASMGVAASAFSAGAWEVVLLEPFGAGSSKCTGASNGVQCGYANFTGQGTALIWNGDRTDYVDIGAGQTTWVSSSANGISGDHVVLSATVGMGRGYKYSISTGTLTDLTPGAFLSVAMVGCDADSDTQVGGGQAMMGQMLLWHGTSKSYVNLTPPGWVSAAAAGCVGNMQVGNGFPGFMGMGRPFITFGTAEGFVDLNPAGATSSGVAGCDASHQVGSVLWPTSMMSHACMWSGSADSVVDLHPPTAQSSAAKACAGNTQVGAYQAAWGYACAWHGTAESFEDLHQPLLDQLGPQFIQSEAVGVDPVTGEIVGNAYTTDGMFMIPHAVLWRPVTVCSADLDGNHVVDSADLAFLLSLWGSPLADITGDGNTDAADLAVLLTAWGAC